MENQRRGRADYRRASVPQADKEVVSLHAKGPAREHDHHRGFRPRRLISLREACSRRGISVRSYWRDTTLLPAPIKGKGKHLFLEEEVDGLIERLLRARS